MYQIAFFCREDVRLCPQYIWTHISTFDDAEARLARGMYQPASLYTLPAPPGNSERDNAQEDGYIMISTTPSAAVVATRRVAMYECGGAECGQRATLPPKSAAIGNKHSFGRHTVQSWVGEAPRQLHQRGYQLGTLPTDTEVMPARDCCSHTHGIYKQY